MWKLQLDRMKKLTGWTRLETTIAYCVAIKRISYDWMSKVRSVHPYLVRPARLDDELYNG